MDNIIKLDLISLKESAGGGNQFDSENNNIFLL